MNAGHDTVVIADGDKKISSSYVFNKIARVEDQHRSEGHAYRRSNRVLNYRHSACALGWHVMALHCSVLRARELFVLRMRTLAIQYPDPWGKSAIPNKENSPPCPGWGEVGANIDRCISASIINTGLSGSIVYNELFTLECGAINQTARFIINIMSCTKL